MRSTSLPFILIALLVSACDNGAGKGSGNGDMAGGQTYQSCTPNRAECVTTTLARVCPADGSGWLPVVCQSTDTCQNGICTPPAPGPTKICEPGAMKCEKGQTGMPDVSLKCNADGTAYDRTNCPAATACIGAGLCEGRCIVGSSTCVSPSQVGTCNADGNGIMAVDCPTDQACVETGSAPFPTAQCKPAECQPSASDCTLECGNRLDANADQTLFMSECRATEAGYKWVVISCPSGTTCADNAGKSCGGPVKFKSDVSLRWDAACVPTNPSCPEGYSHCSGDKLNIITCQGGQEVATPCTSSASTLRACVELGDGVATCGDLLCADQRVGRCTGPSSISLCKDGFLQPSTTCTVGYCSNYAFSGYYGIPQVYYDLAQLQGIEPGQCTTDCNTGDQRCGDGGWVEDCVGNKWVHGADCVNCRQYTKGGVQKAICGATCLPGSSRCQNAVSIPKLSSGASYFSQLQVCGDNGQYQAATACAYGACYNLVPSSDGTVANGVSACLGQCVPNSTVCSGINGPSDPGTYLATTSNRWTGLVLGWDYAIQCDANGRYSTNTNDVVDCDVGVGSAQTKYCRKDSSGKSLGCVDCVGSSLNEQGTKDSRCVAGGPQYCSATNTYPVADPVSCGPSYICQMGTGYTEATCINNF